MNRHLLAAAVAAGALLPLTVAAPASAALLPHVPPPPPCRTATTHLVARPDSGNHGTWALDTITRTVRICQTSLVVQAGVQAPPVDVTAAVQVPVLAHYHATVQDVGSFVTVAGHSPNRGLALCTGCRGRLEGGFTADFTAQAGFALYGAVFAGGTFHGTAPAATADWLVKLWGGADIHVDANLVGWSWTYWTCSPHKPAGTAAVHAAAGGRLWVDAEATADGTSSAAGDITGCTCPEASPSPSHSVSPSPSVSASASPSASASASSSASASPSQSATAGGGVVQPPAPGGAGGGPVEVVRPVGNTNSLPVTGPTVGYVAGAALVLIAVGAAVLVLTRRRRDQFSA